MPRAVLNFVNFICVLCLLIKSTSASSDDLLSHEKFDVSGIDGQQLEDEFEKLNEFLLAKTESSEAELNFNLVFEKYKSDSKRWFKKMSSDSMKAKRLFLAMGQITDENRCTLNSYDILIQIDRATCERSSRGLDPEGVLRRIEKILLDYALKQKEQCHHAHLEQFRDKLASMDSEKVKKVDTFLEPTITSLTSDKYEFNLSKNKTQRLYAIIGEKSLSNSSKNPINALESLKNLTEDDPNANSILVEVNNDTELKEMIFKNQKLHEIYSQYLVEPCRYYIEQLGPEIFKVVYFENKFKHTLDEKIPDFYESWIRYHLCNTFVAHYEYTVWQNRQLNSKGKNQAFNVIRKRF